MNDARHTIELIPDNHRVTMQPDSRQKWIMPAKQYVLWKIVAEALSAQLRRITRVHHEVNVEWTRDQLRFVFVASRSVSSNEELFAPEAKFAAWLEDYRRATTMMVDFSNTYSTHHHLARNITFNQGDNSGCMASYDRQENAIVIHERACWHRLRQMATLIAAARKLGETEIHIWCGTEHFVLATPAEILLGAMPIVDSPCAVVGTLRYFSAKLAKVYFRIWNGSPRQDQEIQVDLSVTPDIPYLAESRDPVRLTFERTHHVNPLAQTKDIYRAMSVEVLDAADAECAPLLGRLI